MSDSLLNKNLTLLKNMDISLYASIEPLSGSKSYKVTESKSGPCSLIYMEGSRIKKQIHSNYDPITEATRYLDTLKVGTSTNFIVLGLGLGYHVLDIILRTSSQVNIFIFEKDPELLALAIRNVDFTPIFEHPGVKLFVDSNPDSIDKILEPVKIDFTLNEFCLVQQKPLVDGNLEYYGSLLDEIDKYFIESKINLKTQTIHSKLYYKNIFSNLDRFLDSPGINLLENALSGIPVIICSAGPSLDKNIQLLKSARQRFFLIAVATALKPLLHNGIQPDIVFSIDPDALTINSFDLSINTSDYWLIFNPVVPGIIPEIFPRRRLAFDSENYLAKWFKKYTEEKGGLGSIFSVAHSAAQFAQFSGCSQIILVGQDLSFSKQSLHCRHTFYNEEHVDKISKLKTLPYWENLKYFNFGPNLTQKRDLYERSITSTIAMESYNEIFSRSFDQPQNVINATEGGIPIKGIQNLSLREALHNYCSERIIGKINPFKILEGYKRKFFKSLKISTSRQMQQLGNISLRLNKLKSKYLSSESHDPENKRLFVNEMNNVFASILADNETALLLQGYDFAGFSDWYRSNNKISNTKELSGDGSLSAEEFERDQKFFKILTEAVDYLMTNFALQPH